MDVSGKFLFYIMYTYFMLIVKYQQNCVIIIYQLPDFTCPNEVPILATFPGLLGPAAPLLPDNCDGNTATSLLKLHAQYPVPNPIHQHYLYYYNLIQTSKL